MVKRWTCGCKDDFGYYMDAIPKEDEYGACVDYTDYAALEAEIARLTAELTARQAFKDYVHKRLDDAGVPVDPPSPHRDAGCRIGGRLDWLLAKNRRLFQDRYDALSVESKEGLLSSEWILRTGKAERRARELEAELAASQARERVLREAIKNGIDLAEFWIERGRERDMSEERYNIWLSLGHRSKSLEKMRAALGEP